MYKIVETFVEKLTVYFYNLNITCIEINRTND